MSAVEPSSSTATVVIDKIVSIGVDGLGPVPGAVASARSHLTQHGDAERAINRLIATHVRIVAATGFATGVGGLLALPVTMPVDMTTLYIYGARCAGAVAHLRGYDVGSEEVRSAVLLTLLGSAGATVLAEAGVQVAGKSLKAALTRLPGTVLIEINKKVGFRLLTKFGSKGVVNLSKLVPLAGGGVGAGMNTVTMRGMGRYAKSNFPAIGQATTIISPLGGE